MIITSDALIDNIRSTLSDEIAPAVADDPWLASCLRSIDSLLPHLGALVEHEWPVLLQDNADLRDTLAALARAGVDPDGIGRALAEGEPPTVTASLGELRDVNRAYRAQLDLVVPMVHEPGREAAHALVRAYLERSLQRRLPIDAALGRVPF